MLRFIKSTLPFHFSDSLNAVDAHDAAREGDLAYLTKFVEHVQLQSKMV